MTAANTRTKCSSRFGDFGEVGDVSKTPRLLSVYSTIHLRE